MELWMDVDAAVTVPVNLLPLLDDTDGKTRETAVAYNAAGLDLIWNFVTTAGVQTHTAVTPTDTGGSYDWVNIGHGMYNIEIPASAGGSINNDTEGFGWFTGVATGVLPWRGPIIGFRAAALNNALIDGGANLTTLLSVGTGAGQLNVSGGKAPATIAAGDLATDSITADALAANAALEIVDAFLARDLGSGTGAGTLDERTVRAALRFLRNKWSMSGATLTVTKEDDTTAAWTATVATNAAAVPTVGVDPT